MSSKAVVKRGIDVSDCQGVINWKAAKDNGVDFVIIRSTRGSGKIDYQFYNNVLGCRENDIPFDVYKYVYALTEKAAENEMKLVCELLKSNNIFCTVWYDIEYENMKKLGRNAITKIVKAAEKVVTSYGFPFGIYCNKYWYNSVIDNTAFQNDFWIAQYPSSRVLTLTTMSALTEKPAVKQKLFGWQCSSKGNVDGISGMVDLDFIYQKVETTVPVQPVISETVLNPYKEPIYTLYRGRLAMSKDYVKWLQYFLVHYGYMNKTYKSGTKTVESIDGYFGEMTESAVQKFQLAHPKTYSTKYPDKKIGAKSRAVLKAGK